jgi:carbonic anhydrase/acetyltransferase-like protein (isoleucine patch superfamily)
MMSISGRGHPMSDAWIAPGAHVLGDVTLDPTASVWYTAVLRADQDSITVGAGSNLQDGVIVHADPGVPVTIGARVSVGHRAVLHGCTIEDEVLVGMGAIILNGARVGTGTIVAAGALITEGADIPPGSLVMGSPGKVRRETTEAERDAIRLNAAHYVTLTEQHRAG